MFDQHIDVADASNVVLADQYRTRTIATLDRRHFDVVRPPCDRLRRRLARMPNSTKVSWSIRRDDIFVDLEAVDDHGPAARPSRSTADQEIGVANACCLVLAGRYRTWTIAGGRTPGLTLPHHHQGEGRE